jgi:hypothetical protein
VETEKQEEAFDHIGAALGDLKRMGHVRCCLPHLDHLRHAGVHACLPQEPMHASLRSRCKPLLRAFASPHLPCRGMGSQWPRHGRPGGFH